MQDGLKSESPGRDERLRQDRLLFEAWHRDGDKRVRDELIERFLPLVRQLARTYQRGSEPLDDLIQVGSVGLIKAIERFDPAREIAFSSYAVPTIVGEIKRHFRDRTWSVRVPRDLQELALRVDKVAAALAEELQHQPSVREIAASASVSEEQVLEALEAGRAYRSTSLDAPRGADGEGETLAESYGTQEGGFALAEDRATLERLLGTISDREREVLRLRFQEDLTQAEIGTIIGVSQMQVSRLLRQALSRLRGAARVDE